MIIFCCYLVVLTGSKLITPVLFLIKEFYIVLLIEQYWSYINSSLTPATAKKVNGPITGIAGLGSVIGGYLVGVFAVPLGTETMILLAAISLLPAALVSNLTYVKHGEPPVPVATEGAGHHYMGWQLFRANPTLLSLLAIVMSAQVVAAVLDLRFQILLSHEFGGMPDKETAFQGRFWSGVSSAGLALQFVIAPLLLSFVAIRWVHLMLPMIHMAAITMAILDPGVFTVGLAFFLFKAFDYSIFRAAKELLYIPLGFDERYRAKEVIDVLGYRTGKGGSAIIFALLQRAGVIMNNYYLAIAFVMTAIWLALIFPLTRPVKSNPDD
jgi:AAA family ATP:ADP antiporter